MAGGSPHIEPLLQALQTQLEEFHAFSDRVEGLITALVSADFPAVQAAVAAQTAALSRVEAAERQRRAAELAVLHTLTGRLPVSGGLRGSLTISALIKRLPAQEAVALSKLRGDMLAALLNLQTRQRQAAVLVRGAQTIVRRTAAAAGVAGVGYGSRGEQAMIEHAGIGRQGRWA
jgi:FlgN protein